MSKKELKKIEKKVVTPSPSPHPPHNHSFNNNHSSPNSQPQVVAVNPLAPSKSVTMATSATTTTGTATTVDRVAGSNWNEQLYYWSLDQAGLTRPIQYGWDPVAPPHNYGSAPLGGNLQLQMQTQTSLWGSRGAFSAPGPNTASAPPVCSSFGAIGNVSTAPPTNSSPRQQQQVESTCVSDGGNDCRGYSLFSGNGQTIFGGSLLNGHVADGGGSGSVSMENGGNCSNEGGSPRKGRFDEWPAL